MKTIKRLVLGVAALALIAVLYVGLTVETRIQNHIEEIVSHLTGVDVTVDSVNVSLFNGNGQINGLQVPNPKGYPEGNAIELGSIKVDMQPASIFSEQIRVNSIVLDSTTVNLDVQDDLKSNLQEILKVSDKQLGIDRKKGKKKKKKKKKKSSGAGDEAENGSEAGDENGDAIEESDESVAEGEEAGSDEIYHLLVKEFTLSNISVNARYKDDQWSETVEDITITDVRGEKGMNTRALGVMVVNMLTLEVAEQAARGKLEQTAVEKVEELGAKLLEKLLENN